MNSDNDRLFTECAEIFTMAKFREQRLNLSLVVKPRVIGAERNLHLVRF